MPRSNPGSYPPRAADTSLPASRTALPLPVTHNQEIFAAAATSPQVGFAAGFRLLSEMRHAEPARTGLLHSPRDRTGAPRSPDLAVCANKLRQHRHCQRRLLTTATNSAWGVTHVYRPKYLAFFDRKVPRCCWLSCSFGL